MLALAIAASWLSSESALVTLLDYAVAQSDGKLTIDKPRGTLLGRIEIGRIVYRDEGTTVTIEDVSLDHAPRTLLDRRLTITRADGEARADRRAAEDDEPAIDAGFARDPDRRDDRARNDQASRMAITAATRVRSTTSGFPTPAIAACIACRIWTSAAQAASLAGSREASEPRDRFRRAHR